jgi:hypothetical protein
VAGRIALELELGAFSGPSGPEGKTLSFPQLHFLCLNSYNISIINPTKHHSFIRLLLEALRELYTLFRTKLRRLGVLSRALAHSPATALELKLLPLSKSQLSFNSGVRH